MSSLPAVPKPSNAGTGQVAIANTVSAYVNIRNGPGTNYRDIGDIRDNTIVLYYPNSRRSDGNRDWVWIEQYGLAGWVATWVVTFEPAALPAPVAPDQATPYDGGIALWHWKGDVLPENTIEDVVRNIKEVAPNVKHLFVKTSDYTPSAGARWQGHWDTKRALAIDGPQSIDNWVQVLQRYNMHFHAWCVPRGIDIKAETDLIIQACLRPGVKSMILDVEPFAGFWSAGREGVRPFMTRIRRAIPGAFHIGLGIDPRPHHFDAIFAPEWFPFVNSVHTMSYWATFRRSPDEVLRETYDTWGNYGRPIIPILQGDAQRSDMETAHTLATQRHGARAVSWWRLGVIGPVEWVAVNRPVTFEAPDPEPPDTPPTPAPPPQPPGNQYSDVLIVRPEDSGFAHGSYTGREELKSFAGTWGWRSYYKATEQQTSKVWARWATPLPQSGHYELSTFVPNRHATTRNARFKVHGVKNTESEVVVDIDQSRYSNTWVTLGVFEFDATTDNAGTVFLNDLTNESGREIAFDAMRWRRVVETDTDVEVPVGFADGYDSPVGTPSERASDKLWPGRWYDASPFGRLYFRGTPNEAYHTGADLNLPSDADAHDPVSAAASGVVVFASRLRVWGNVIIIKHDPLVTNGVELYGRYAHVENMKVKVGDRVTRGQQIASVGNAFGQWAYHLHFDLSPTTILESNPAHWPGRNKSALDKNYIDPKQFIENNRPVNR
ncbi:MAG: hypothetical protein D6737_19750 [Chloroflexi bacterium]|nr:MAG: hypothetical protein CUN54_04325 [Phototrophicales bacterium]RMF76682.1 MAG: hypothetical protein D6737_19750 [Chloroflexota bacterium]